MINSLRRISPAEAAAIRPRIIHVETVRPGDTVQSLSSRMAYRDFRLERFLSLNGLAANSTLVPGEGEAGRLSARGEAEPTLNSVHIGVHRGSKLAPLAANTTAELLHAADRGDRDQRDN